jgi:hypothetical protein
VQGSSRCALTYPVSFVQGRNDARYDLMNKQLHILFSAACLLFLLTACSSSPTSTLAIAPSVVPTASPSPVPTLTPSPTLRPTDLWIGSSDVQIHPDGDLYSGDRISFHISAHNDSQATLFRVPVQVQAGNRSFEATIGSIGASESNSTDLTWVWNTAGLSGTQPVTITLDPNQTLIAGDENRTNDRVAFQIDLNPIAAQPLSERNAKWVTVTSHCCHIHYISGTTAERDITTIKQTIDDALAFVTDRMKRIPPPKLDVYLIDRVLGQGGLANSVVIISYLDRNYASGEFSQVMRHEFSHLLDRSRLHGHQPLFLLEGFAVYTTGGHYRIESVANRAAALLGTDRYLPLKKLIDNFYPSQHETGYAEAAAFLQYLVERFGAEKFDRFYTNLPHAPSLSDSELIDRGLLQTFNIGLDDLERDWQAWLRKQPVTDADRTSMTDSIAYYDAVRRYEQLADPSAYLLSFWTPDIQSAEARGITADYQRQPDRPENIALETMLIAADQSLAHGDRDSFSALLASVNDVLDHHLQFDDPLAAQYLAVVRAIVADGYEPQSIVIANGIAEVVATRGAAALVHLTAKLDRDQWTLQLAE